MYIRANGGPFFLLNVILGEQPSQDGGSGKRRRRRRGKEFTRQIVRGEDGNLYLAPVGWKPETQGAKPTAVVRATPEAVQKALGLHETEIVLPIREDEDLIWLTIFSEI